MENSLKEKLDKFQSLHYLPYSKWNKETYFVIIAITQKHEPIILLKSLALNIENSTCELTFTENPADACLIHSNIATMLYHYGKLFPGLENISLYPVSLKKEGFINGTK